MILTESQAQAADRALTALQDENIRTVAIALMQADAAYAQVIATPFGSIEVRKVTGKASTSGSEFFAKRSDFQKAYGLAVGVP